MKTNKKPILILLILLMTILMCIPVNAADIKSEKKHKVTFKFDKPEDLELTGELLTFYVTDESIICVELNEENKWTQTLDVIEGEYSLFQNIYNNPFETENYQFLTTDKIRINKDQDVLIFLKHNDEIVNFKDITPPKNLISENLEVTKYKETHNKDAGTVEKYVASEFTVENSTPITEKKEEIQQKTDSNTENEVDLIILIPLVIGIIVIFIILFIILDIKKQKTNEGINQRNRQ